MNSSEPRVTPPTLARALVAALALGAACLAAYGCSPAADGKTQLAHEATSPAQAASSDTSAGPARATEPTTAPLLGITLPTTVDRLISRFGTPTAVILPRHPNVDASYGQMFQWALPTAAGTLTAVGDDKDPSRPSFRAGVRYIELEAAPGGPATETLYGLLLPGTTLREAEQRLGSLSTDTWHGMAPSSTRRFANTRTVLYGSPGPYLFFDPDGRLVGVAESSYNVHAF